MKNDKKQTNKKQIEKQKATVEQQNEEFELDNGSSLGIYHHVSFSGAGFQVTVTTPSNGINFGDVVYYAQFLALFCIDDSLKDIARKNLKDNLKKYLSDS